MRVLSGCNSSPTCANRCARASRTVRACTSLPQWGYKPPLDVQQDPPLVGVPRDRLEHEGMINAVEELLDVQVDHPVGSPAAPPADLHRVLRGSPGTVAVRVRMEGRLDPRLQSAGYHRLSDPVGHGRHPQNSGAPTMRLRYFHRPHRRREVAPRGHPIPDLVQIVLQIGLEVLDGAPVPPRCTLIGLDLLPRLPNLRFRDLERLAG